MRLPVPTGVGSGPSNYTQTVPPLAIVALVILVGATLYLWRGGYIRSRATLIVLAAFAGLLVYLGFFAFTPPT